MKKRKKHRRIRKTIIHSDNQSISAMMAKFAFDYINLGSDLEEKQSYLNGACVAWNIAILDEKQRERALNAFIEDYESMNPGVGDSEDLRHDMEMLIQEKIRLYPHVNKMIVNARIVDDNGKEKIYVVSTDFHK